MFFNKQNVALLEYTVVDKRYKKNALQSSFRLSCNSLQETKVYCTITLKSFAS